MVCGSWKGSWTLRSWTLVLGTLSVAALVRPLLALATAAWTAVRRRALEPPPAAAASEQILARPLLAAGASLPPPAAAASGDVAALTASAALPPVRADEKDRSDAAPAVPAVLPPVRAAEKERKATCTFADRVARCALDEFERLSAAAGVEYKQTVMAGGAAARTQSCLPCHARLQVRLRLEPSTASHGIPMGASTACAAPATSVAPSLDPRFDPHRRR